MKIAVLIVAFGAFVVGAIAATLMRVARRARDLQNQMAGRHDEALKALAKRAGLKFVAGAGHDHPLMGRYQGWGSAEGTTGDLVVRVEQKSQGEDPVELKTRLCLTPAGGASFDVEAGTFALPKDLDRLREAMGQADTEMLDELAACVERLELDPQAVTLTARPPPSKEKRLPFESFSFGVVTDPAALGALLDVGGRLALELLPKA